MIPKRIIQTGKTQDLSILENASAMSVQKLNPNFEYIFYDDVMIEKFFNKECPEYKEVFYSFQEPIQKIDFFRYLAIYKYGGFYFDLDFILASSLEDLLEYNCVFSFEELTINKYLVNNGLDWEIANYAFGATPGHPFIHSIIQNCVLAQKEPKWVDIMIKSIPKIFREDFNIFYSTGPGLVSRTFLEYNNKDFQVNILLPKNVLDKKSWHCFGKYGIHLAHGTWVKDKGIFLSKLAKIWLTLKRRKLISKKSRPVKNMP